MSKSKQQVRVSYIISTRNRAEFLARTLQNIREFITPEDELIIMDGASTDNTAEVARKNADIITLFRSEPDCGEAHGYNKAILESRGRFIKLITDDDYFYNDAMRQVIELMEKHPEIDALMTGGEAYEIDAVSKQEKLVTYLRLPSTRRLTDDINNILTFVQCGLGLVLTRRVLTRVGLFDTSFRAVDTDYMGRLFAHNVEFRYLDVKLFRHICHAGSGQNNWPECRRDRLLTLVRNKAWVNLFNQDLYPLSAVAAVFGLEGLPGADRLMRLIFLGERARLHKTGRILMDFMVKVLQIHVWLLRMIWKIKMRLSDDSAETPSTPISSSSAFVEPVWDGMLR